MKWCETRILLSIGSAPTLEKWGQTLFDLREGRREADKKVGDGIPLSLFYIRIVVRIVPTGRGFTVVGGAEDGRTLSIGRNMLDFV